MGKIESPKERDKKVIILKNDRGGDLMNSLKSICSIIKKEKNVTIFLSEMNINFKFMFENLSVKQLKYDLDIIDKIKLFFYILTNDIEKIFILAPKNYFFYLAFIFRKIKFYAVVIDGVKRNRPPIFLRKYLYKYKIINRKVRIKDHTSEEKQLLLVNNNAKISDEVFNTLTIKKKINFVDSIMPKNFFFFHYKEKFFNKIDWDLNKLDEFFNLLLTKCDNVLFSSDIKNAINKKFIEKYSYVNFNNNEKFDNPNNRNNILYLHDINIENMLYVIQSSKKSICPHGTVSNISIFCGIPTLALFSYDIKNKIDYHHEMLSFYEWYGNKSMDFSFLNNDFGKSIRKISTRI